MIFLLLMDFIHCNLKTLIRHPCVSVIKRSKIFLTDILKYTYLQNTSQ